MVSRVVVAQIMKHLYPIVSTRKRRTLRRSYITVRVQIEFGILMDMASWNLVTLKHMVAWMDIAGVFHLCFNYLLIAKRVPRKYVDDRGTENVNIAGSQRFLRRYHSDDSSGYQSFQFGKSIKNQRIESFWSQLCRSCADWWICFFKGIVHEGTYTITMIIYRLNVLSFAFFL